MSDDTNHLVRHLYVAFYPARERELIGERHWTERPKIPGLAHLWQLFVLPEWWGRGVAPLLHHAR